jgi:hypothetical protein
VSEAEKLGYKSTIDVYSEEIPGKNLDSLIGRAVAKIPVPGTAVPAIFLL